MIDTDCTPVGECEDVTSTIGVDAWSGQVVFDDSGAAGYVRHYTSSNISLVE